MSLTICAVCGYAAEGTCGNPACANNPNLSEDKLRQLLEARQRRERQEEERAMLRRARESAYERGKRI